MTATVGGGMVRGAGIEQKGRRTLEHGQQCTELWGSIRELNVMENIIKKILRVYAILKWKKKKERPIS